MKRLISAFLVVLLTATFAGAIYMNAPWKDKGGELGEEAHRWNAIWADQAMLDNASPLVFEGATEDAYETTFAIADPSADRTITFPDSSGTIVLNPVTTSWTLEGATADEHEMFFQTFDPTKDVYYELSIPTDTACAATGTACAVVSSSLKLNGQGAANSVNMASNSVIFEGTDDAFETILTPVDATADATITLPNATGTVSLVAGAGSYRSVEAVTTTAEALLTSADCGKTIMLNHASTGIDVFLPAVTGLSGCYIKTIVMVAFSDDHTINTNAGADLMVGHISEVANTSTGVSDTDADILTLVDSTESVGDYCEFITNGTMWYFNCTVGVDGGMTTGTT